MYLSFFDTIAAASDSLFQDGYLYTNARVRMEFRAV